MPERENRNLNIIDIVKTIKRKPEMFFGEKPDIYNLYYYLLGYTGSRISTGISDKDDEKYQFEFGSWIYRKHESVLEHDMFWAKAISTMQKIKDKQVELFFSLFEEFFNLKNADEDNTY